MKLILKHSIFEYHSQFQNDLRFVPYEQTEDIKTDLTAMGEVADFDDEKRFLIKWTFHLVYNHMPVYSCYLRQHYGLTEINTEINISEIEEAVKYTFDKFNKEFEASKDRYNIPLVIDPISDEEIQQTAQRLHLKLLPLHELK